ncbi:MAG: LamG domain-containing protein [Verrucomicrobiota bacterium]
MKTYSPRSGPVPRKSNLPKHSGGGPRHAVSKLRSYSPPNGPARASGRPAGNPFYRRRGSNASTEPKPFLEISANGSQALIYIDAAVQPSEWRTQHCPDGVSWGDFTSTFAGSNTSLMVDTMVFEYVRIRGFDAEGNAVTDFSNAVFVLQPPPVLGAELETSILNWTWGDNETTDPFRWNVWMSLDGGLSFFLAEDYWATGSARSFSPDGGSETYFVVGVDEDGNEVTLRSNRICPDEVPPPLTLVDFLSGYWAMDEYEGDVLDSSGNQNHGVIVGGDYVWRHQVGKLGYCLQALDTTEQVRVGTPKLITGSFTISAWINTSSEAFATPISATTSGCRGMGVSCANDATYFTVYSGDSDYNPGSTNGGATVVGDPIMDGEWHHVVGIYNASTRSVALYIDGALADATIGDYDFYPAPDTLTFFDNTSCFGQLLIGKMDDVALWDRALSLADVGRLYNSGNGLALANF